MLVADLLLTLTRAFFVLLAALTVADYLAHRDPIRRDVALVFVSLALTTIVSLFLAITNLPWPWLAKIGQIGIVSHPVLLLRLVAYFRPINRDIRRVAIVGWLASTAVIILFNPPFPPVLTLPIIAYFIAINGYAVTGFIRGALSSSGVTRNRLRFAAVGSVLLILVFFVAGVRLALPALWGDITPLVQFATMVTVLTYYLGFTPPRWLRQSWQFAELREYLLKDISVMPNQSPTYVLMHLRQAVNRALGTQKVYIALWNKENSKLVMDDTSGAIPFAYIDLNADLIQRIWQGNKPTVLYKQKSLTEEAADVLHKMGVQMLFIVPIATTETQLGVMVVGLENGSLFVDDDLNLLNIFTQQTAIFLENYNILEQQRSYARDLEQMVLQRTQALQSSNNDLRQFAYVASHDLQEPLRMVVSYLQLIEERYISKMDEEAREFISFAIDGGKRMKTLIEALLAYSRVETKVKNFAEVDMQDVVNEVQKLLKVMINEKNAVITVDPLPAVYGNETMLIQLVQNLVSNGMKYQKERTPQIHISAGQENNEWVFSIRDNGIGIAAKDLDRIFVIFQRLHTGQQYPGTGIGLAVCKKVIEHHGGRIWAESIEGEGTVFYFTIPVMKGVSASALPVMVHS